MKRWIDKPFLFDALLESEGFIGLRIQGNSMWPLLHPGECVSVRKHDILQRGECYLFSYAGSVLLHRLAEKGCNTCVFCSDNGSSIETVPSLQVLGKVDDGRSPVFHFLVTCLNRLFVFFNCNNSPTSYRGNSIRRVLIRQFLKIDTLFYGRERNNECEEAGE